MKGLDSGTPRADARFPGMTGWDLGVDVKICKSVQSVNPYENVNARFAVVDADSLDSSDVSILPPQRRSGQSSD